MGNMLIAPAGYWKLSKQEHDCICGGCGPGKWGALLVPDKLWLIGVDFGPACDIHDYCYQTWTPREKADNMFLDNMTIIADTAWWGVRWLAHRCAFLYYLAVKHLGAGAYYRGKEIS